MKKITLLLLLFHLIAFATKGQALYEIKFTAPDDTTEYRCLLVYNNEDDAYGRISYYKKGIYRVVHTTYKGQSGKWDDGTKYFSLTGSDTYFVTTSNEGENYFPDYFVWLNDEDKPYTTDRVSNDGNRYIHKVSEYSSLEVEDLTKDYLRSFYKSDEDDYLALVEMTTDYEEPTEENYSATLHLMVVANTSISDIGAGCKVDLDHLKEEFDGIAKALKISFNPVIIKGSDFSKEIVLQQINALNVKADDIVIFVYRGHGFRWSDQESPYPCLALTLSQSTPVTDDNTMLLETPFKMLQAKGGRLNLVLADCCNSSIGRPQLAVNNNILYMQSNMSARIEKLSDLFLNRKGSLIISASDQGEVSWTNNVNGGFFTSSFLQALAEETSYLKSNEGSWINIINTTKTYAHNKTLSCPTCYDKQNAIYKNLITKK